MKLYYGPGTCALGIHVLLEEIGKPYDTQIVDIRGGEQYKPAFQAINPKGKVPVLQFADGSVLTEWPAIATYLAYDNKDAGLVPEQHKAAAHVIETVNYIAGTMHMNGFVRIFRPSLFSENEAEAAAIKAKGMEIFSQGFELVAHTLGDKDYLFGAYSIADAALFYVTFWANGIKLAVPAAVTAHFNRMMARPAVRRAMQAEGLA